MSSHLDSSAETFLSFQLKGGLYPLTALQLLEPNLAVFDQQLETKIQQAPKFFLHAPVVIDIQKLKSGASLDFIKLKDILLKKHLVPVGVKGGQPEQQAAAVLAGLAIFQEGNKEKEQEAKDQKQDQKKEQNQDQIQDQKLDQKQAHAQTIQLPEEESTEIKGSNTKVITEPVRSGQQIYARGGDLVVIAPVSHGAELLADGNIHIYGSLRGRALAGVTGDQNAHIFCQSLEAELISVAGQYKISEDIDQSIWRLAVDISVVGGRLHIQPF